MRIKAKFAFNKKRVAIVVAIFAAILIMVFSNPEVYDFLSKEDSVQLDFQAGMKYDSAVYGKDMLVINNEGITAIDDRGRQEWSIVCGATDPAVMVKGDIIMLADLNGKSVSTFEMDKQVMQIQTENEILSAKVNKNGYIAIASVELGYKGLVTLYDKKGEAAYKWHSGSGYIGDIDISEKNCIAAAQIITDGESARSRILIIDPSSSEEPKSIAEIDGIVMKLKFTSNKRLVAVSEKGFYGLKLSGKKLFEQSFAGKTPGFFNIENPRNMVFAFDDGLNNTVVESYSSKGKLRGSYTASGDIKAIDVNGECILAAGNDGIVWLTPKGSVKKRMTSNRDVEQVRVFPDRNNFLLLSSGSAKILKLK